MNDGQTTIAFTEPRDRNTSYGAMLMIAKKDQNTPTFSRFGNEKLGSSDEVQLAERTAEKAQGITWVVRTH